MSDQDITRRSTDSSSQLGRHPSAGGVHIGCSGWQYRHWRGSFYPQALPLAQWLPYYAERFNTVEVNNTFYRLPEAETFAAWRARAPARFVYAVKASRFLTHMKKLKDPQEPLRRFFTRARRLGPALGPVLYQLPPRFDLNLERLDQFLEALPDTHQHVLEVRDPRWYVDAVYERLSARGVALCLHDMPGSATERLVTAPFVYTRFHGPVRYGGSYSDRTLERWAAWFTARANEGCAVYSYFNNDVGGHAPHDAVRLRELIAL